MKEFIIQKNEENQRFDKYLLKLLKKSGKGYIYKMLRKRSITLNGKKAEGSVLYSEKKRGEIRDLFYNNGVDIDVFKPTPSDLRKQLGLEDKYIILGPASKWLQPVNQSVLTYFSEHMQSDEVLLLFGATNCSLLLPKNIRLYGYTNKR